MPYSTTDTNLPENVKKLSAKQRRQWIHVFNSAYARASGTMAQKEAAAFKQANGVVRNKELDIDVLDAPHYTPPGGPVVQNVPLGMPAFVDSGLASRYGVQAQQQPVTINIGNKDAWVQPHEQPTAYVPYTVEQHQLSQDVTDYGATKGTAEHACANCQWMLSPDGCILVHGVIAPTGWCKLWTQEEPEQRDALPVEVVNTDAIANAIAANSETPTHITMRELMAQNSEVPPAPAPAPVAPSTPTQRTGIAKLWASMWHTDATTPTTPAPAFNLTWTTKEDGTRQLRWFGTWTNVFEDRSHDILPTFSHKEYVDYVDREGAYPELLYWHIIGTEFGKTDWMEYDGMLTHAAGYVYDDPYSIAFATRLAEQTDLGMSHGTIYRTSESGDILQHRTFELSTLPRENANNAGTVWIALKDGEATTEDEAMAFSDKKRASLKQLSGLTDDQVAALEKQTEAFRDEMVAKGIQWKSDDDIVPDDQGDTESVLTLGNLAQAITNLSAAVATGFDALGAQIKEAKTTADTALSTANKSADELVADAITPGNAAAAAQARGAAYVATKADDNVTGAPSGLTTDQRNKDSAWAKEFMGLVFGETPNVPAGTPKQ